MALDLALPFRQAAPVTEARRVWYAAWEMQCCGDPFEIGSHVQWQTRRVDSEWFESLLGAAEAARVTDMVDHHPDEGALLTRLSGVVIAVDAVTCRYERLENCHAMTPVPLSGVLRAVTKSDGWEREDNGATFVAYAVDVVLDAPGRS